MYLNEDNDQSDYLAAIALLRKHSIDQNVPSTKMGRLKKNALKSHRVIMSLAMTTTAACVNTACVEIKTSSLNFVIANRSREVFNSRSSFWSENGIKISKLAPVKISSADAKIQDFSVLKVSIPGNRTAVPIRSSAQFDQIWPNRLLWFRLEYRSLSSGDVY